MNKLFKIELDAHELQKYKRYKDLEEEIFDLTRNSSITAEIAGKLGNYNIYSLHAGNPNSDKRIMIAAGHHGGEEAGPIAAIEILKELANPETEDMKLLLENAYITVVPCVDPEGFDHRGRRFVDMDGKGELWPIDKGRWWGDINGTHGRRDPETKPPEALAVEQVLEKTSPELVFDLHETISSYNNRVSPFLEYKGLMVIQDVKDGDNEGEAIVHNLIDRGYDIFHEGVMEKVIKKIAPVPEQVVKVGEGRYEIGPLIKELGVSVFTMLAKEKGANAYTFETFDNPLSYRVASHMAGVEGGIMDYMGYKPTESAGAFRGKIKDIEEFASKIFDNYEIEKKEFRGKSLGIFPAIREYIRIIGEHAEIDLYGKAGSDKYYIDVKYAKAFDDKAEYMKQVAEELSQSKKIKPIEYSKLEKTMEDTIYNPKSFIKEGIEEIEASIIAGAHKFAQRLKDMLTDTDYI